MRCDHCATRTVLGYALCLTVRERIHAGAYLFPPFHVRFTAFPCFANMAFVFLCNTSVKFAICTHPGSALSTESRMVSRRLEL